MRKAPADANSALGTCLAAAFFDTESDVLLRAIGAGESGKSTILKQMRIIHSRGFHTQERQWWRRIIFHNIIETFEMINDAMTDFTIHFDNADNEVSLPLRDNRARAHLE